MSLTDKLLFAAVLLCGAGAAFILGLWLWYDRRYPRRYPRGTGLVDEHGYVTFPVPGGGAVRVHVQLLRQHPLGEVAAMTGVPEDVLRRWADGPALPLGLWTRADRDRRQPTEEVRR